MSVRIPRPDDITASIHRDEDRVARILPKKTADYYTVVVETLGWFEGRSGDFTTYNDHTIRCTDANAERFLVGGPGWRDDVSLKEGEEDGCLGAYDSLIEAMLFIDCRL